MKVKGHDGQGTVENSTFPAGAYPGAGVSYGPGRRSCQGSPARCLNFIIRG